MSFLEVRERCVEAPRATGLPAGATSTLCTTIRRRNARRVGERGMVSVAALFMVLFATAVVWCMIGVGKTLYAREGLQDAADAAAFSAAVFHARGMNLIALINVIMAALVAVLLALRMAQTVLQILAVVFLALSYFGGSTAALATSAQNGASVVGNAFKTAKNIVEPVLEALHTLQEATSVIVPYAALVDGMIEAAENHPPAQGAFALPASATLPVESDEFRELCNRGTDMVVDGTLLASGLYAFEGYGVTEPIEGALTGLAELTALFMCGAGKGDPPEYKHEVEVRYPRPAGYSSCESDVGSAECAEARRQIELARPHPTTGNCVTDCGPSGPYATFARMARFTCNPRRLSGLKNFTWQENRVRARLRYAGNRWTEVSREETRRLRKSDTDAPCREEWMVEPGLRLERPEPVCTIGDPIPPGPARGSQEVVREYTEILHVFSCVRKEEKGFPVADAGQAFGPGSGSSVSSGSDASSGPGGGDSSGADQNAGSQGSGQGSGSDSDDKSPHKVEEGLALGDDTFQIRAVSFGPKPGPRDAWGWVRLIDRNDETSAEKTSNTVAEVLNNVGRISVAQAEYYFDGTTDAEEWLWQMRWTARLKRFRLPQGQDAEQAEQKREDRAQGAQDQLMQFGGQLDVSSVAGACSLSGADFCDTIESSVDDLGGIVKH